MLRIPLPQIVELRDILAEALTLPEMDDALLRLGVNRSRITLAGSLDQIYREVIVHFNNRDAVDDLLEPTQCFGVHNA